MSKFTAEGLVVFYQKVADGGTMYHDKYHTGKTKHENSEGPDMGSLASEWSVLPKKPAKKIIDLQPLIASGIDCEFKDADNDTWQIIGPLSCAAGSVKFPYQRKGMEHVAWEQCRPRMDHTMFHNGGECPLPEGFEVQLSYCKGVACNTSDYTSKRWNDVGNNADIIGYKILGLADGYAYPWEQTE